MNSPRTTLYKDTRNAKLMGVCAGIADYTGIDAAWVRLGAVLLTLFALGPLLLVAYGVMGFVLKQKPFDLYSDDTRETRYWQGVRQSPKRTAREIRGRMKDIDRRLSEIEAHYVGGNAQLADEIERLR